MSEYFYWGSSADHNMTAAAHQMNLAANLIWEAMQRFATAADDLAEALRTAKEVTGPAINGTGRTSPIS